MYKIIIASGYFNPLHKGHIEYLEKAKALGDLLVVIVNNDGQVALKGSQRFMEFKERLSVISALRCVDYVVPSIDLDKSVCKSISKVVSIFRYFVNLKASFIFAKGGDRCIENIPERKECNKIGVTIVDGLGTKIQSSSELLKKRKL